MTRNAEGASPRDLMVAVADVLVLAEPLLLRLWKDSRVTLGHLRVLRALLERPRSPGDLAALSGATPPTVARLLARLEERGLVTRSIDPSDRRRIEVRLTESGRETLNRSHVLKGSIFQRAADTLTADERSRLVTALTGFTTAVRTLQAADPESQEQPA